MAWKRRAAEAAVWTAARMCVSRRTAPDSPRSLFVLRNNDLGDLLVITPLFDALRRLFPDARIVAGVGEWNVEMLRGNPHLSDIMVVNAPWHNRVTGVAGHAAALRYIAGSGELARVRGGCFDVGIDVLGSVFGSLLMLRAGIPVRLGVKGYAGGHTAVHRFVEYNAHEHVGRSALRFAELLGATDLPDHRPQLFLGTNEIEEAERLWRAATGAAAVRRVVLAPGGGHPGRVWPVDHFAGLGERLARDSRVALVVLGGSADVDAGARVSAAGARNLTARLTLRQSFAMIARAHLVFCNSSVAMHAAAACGVPAVVLLGPEYASASAHASQWGHGPFSLVLGCDDRRATIYTPDDVLWAVAGHPRYATALSDATATVNA